MEGNKNAINQMKLKTVSYLLMFVFIATIIPLHLFPCFISSFLSYEIITSLTPIFERFVGIKRARWIVVTLIFIFVIIIMTLSIVSLTHCLTSDINRNIDIITEINRIFFDLKSFIPDFLLSFLPESSKELKNQIFSLIESNIIFIRNISHTLLHGLITIFLGIIIGAIISLNKSSDLNTYFTMQLLERLYYLSQAFRNIVFAQIKISLINTILTAIMILIIFPIFCINLPLSKTLIVITFIFGLIPIIGNLISNFMIILSSLSVSLTVGGIMSVYLIFIHKLEYFLNAEIIGDKIQAKSWELLLAILIFESAFGIEGLIAAPIYYAYLKTELRAHHLV